ncbi:hypothetical protein ACNFR7_31285 [Streptomyces sp. RM1]|uniref:hypothetical protein n=1 Tax=Streptomyces misionensis TaxID=67331 RepID=UPI003BAE85B2
MNARTLIAAGTTVTVLTASSLAFYFSRVGLDKADKTASVLGLFIALAGLAISIYGLLEARRSDTTPPSTQKVSSSSVSGSNIQIGQAGGSVRIKRSAPQAAPTPHNPNLSTSPPAINNNGGQEVQNSQISGSNFQLGSSTGDVEVDES